TYQELLFQLQQLAGNIVVNDENPYVPVIIVGGVIYIAMCLALSALATWIERRGRRAKTGIRVADAGQPLAAADALDVVDQSATSAPDASVGKTN
ncbi:amino acid ABC transporter permease, partial [Streptomyces albiflaviniger]|nr:amino acid ABC transporter permease [Streptomyces albiflaviniger]